MTEPRWLNADERRAWLAQLSINTLLPAALDTQLHAAGKLSGEKLQVAELKRSGRRKFHTTAGYARFTTRSNLTGACTGRSAALAPRRIRST